MNKFTTIIILTIALIFSCISTDLFAKDNSKVAVLEMKAVDSDSKYVAKMMIKRDFKKLIKDADGFEFIDQDESDDAVKNAGFSYLIYLDPVNDLLPLGNKLGADLIIWGTVNSKSSSEYNVKIQVMSTETKSINEFAFVTEKKTSSRRKAIKKNLIDELSNLGGAEIEKLFNLAQQQIKRDDFKAAIQTLNNITKIDDSNVEYFINLGYSHYKLGNYDKASQNYEKALEIEPENLKIYDYYGTNLRKQGKPYKAIEIFEKKVAISNDANDWNKIGAIYEAEYDTESAADAFAAAIEIDPQNQLANYKLAMIYENQENYEKALPYLEIAAKQNPDDEDISEKLGKAYMKTGKMEAAIKNYKSIIAEQPENIKAYKSLAASYQILNKNNEAINTLKKLEELIPEDDNIKFDIADSYVTLKDFNKAKEYANKGQKSNPDNYRSYYILADISQKKGYKLYEKYLELDAKKDAGELYGEELDKLIANRDNTKKEAYNYFKKANDLLNKALNKATKHSDKKTITKKLELVKKLMKETKPDFFG